MNQGDEDRLLGRCWKNIVLDFLWMKHVTGAETVW